MFFPCKVKFTIDFSDFYVIILFVRADVMELADVTDSKSVALTGMRVRPPPSAPKAPFGVLFQLYPIRAVRKSSGALSFRKSTFVHRGDLRPAFPPAWKQNRKNLAAAAFSRQRRYYFYIDTFV